VALPPPGRFDANKLREARIELGITQADLAKRIGVDPGVVNSWEVRGARPSVPNLGRVASALGLTVPDLYRSDAGAAGSLVDLRVRAGLSQREAAELLKVSQARISRWERGVSRPNWEELSSYAQVLNTDRITVGAAVDLTANQHGNPPKRGRVVQPSAFNLTASSPHIIYDFEDSEGAVELSSPQFPFLAFRTTFTNPLMRELAVINEYFNADYFHRYNHLQRRCRGPETGGEVYLIRWLPAFHETADLETHSRGITAAMLIGQVEAVGFLTVGSRALPTGEYLIIVVEPEDTLEFLFGQIVRGVPVTFCPTRCDDEVGPLEVLWEDGSDSPTGWHGAFRPGSMPAGMTFAELFRHLRSVNPPPCTAEATPGSPQTDVVRSIHRTFSKSTSRRQTKARASAPQR
jgi:transcriptional regulator with XRE-family HTH domain